VAVEISYAFTVPADVDRIARALCSEAYTLESASVRDDVASVTHRFIREDERGVEYEVLYVEYARGRTGTIDRRRTHGARARCVWDAAARTLRWSYTTQWSARFSLEGVYRLTPRGEEETHLDYRATIDVRIPLIGNQLAKLVARDHEQDMPRLQALITKHAALVT
jgi:hypothetical protein